MWCAWCQVLGVIVARGERSVSIKFTQDVTYNWDSPNRLVSRQSQCLTPPAVVQDVVDPASPLADCGRDWST